MIAKKIKAINDNKVGVDGIPPRLLMDRVDEVSIPRRSGSF